MRRLLAVLGVVAAQAIWWAAPVAAQSDLLFGEQHSYSVTMRGNGESVVTARIVFTNTGDQPQTSFKFEIPNLTVTDLSGYQQHIVPTCLNYASPAASGAAGGASVSSMLLPTRCLTYNQPDYVQPVGDGANESYVKLKIMSDGGGKFHVDLPNAVAPQDSSALLLGYAGKGYVTSRLGAYTFNFQTIKVNERIKDATVAVDVDSDLYLLDGQAKVTYSKSQSGAAAAIASGTAAAQSNAALDQVAYGVGAGGEINKETHDLAAGDTYSVRGTYADAAWKLHPWTVLILGLIGLGLIVLVVWMVRRMRHPKPTVSSVNHEGAEAKAEAQSAGGQVHQAARLAEPIFIIVGMASAVTVGLLTWGLAYYSNQGDGTTDVFSTVLTAIVGILAYVLIIVGPVVWLATKRRDWRVALYVFVWQVIWLVIVLLVYQQLLNPMFNTGSPSNIEPLNAASSSGN